MTSLQSLIDRSTELHQQRIEYLAKQELDKRAKQEQNKAQTIDHYFSAAPLTKQQLLDYGKNLATEYSNTHITTMNEVMGAEKNLYQFWQIPALDEDDVIPTLKRKRWGPQEEEEEETNLQYKATAAENAEAEYYRALQTLLQYDITIYSVEKDLSKFKNRNWSACLSSVTDVYVFYCMKNSYRFVATFADDCDCEPGILSISRVVYVPTNIEIKVDCDLYTQNNSKVHLIDFLTLLSSASPEHYFETRYGSLLKLPAELSNRGYRVTVISNTTDSIHYASYNINYILELEKDNQILWLILTVGENEYCLNICRSPSEQKNSAKERTFISWDGSERDYGQKFDINDFNSLYQDWGCSNDKYFRYEPINLNQVDYDQLDLTIRSFSNLVKGTYGYLENNTYYNNSTIIEYCKEHKFKYTTGTVDPLRGPQIDIKMIVELGKYKAFPFEYYIIRFHYDNSTMQDCTVTIKGAYNTDNNFNNFICDQTRTGSFSFVFKEIKEFIAAITYPALP